MRVVSCNALETTGLGQKEGRLHLGHWLLGVEMTISQPGPPAQRYPLVKLIEVLAASTAAAEVILRSWGSDSDTPF